MATYEKAKLSGASATNVPIPFSGLTFHTVHQCPSPSTIDDEVWLWVHNATSSSVDVSLHIYDIDVTANFTFSISAKSTVMVLGGHLFTGNAFIQVSDNSSTSSGLFVYGYANRITS